ncbi:Uncharacterized protein Adt_20260 [Abeliophyllum distichum]|uniref:Uncharacterized protein n=1 Tax=Abeliophyllum distichum TaxID=126358 RepID=A0ABD1SW20_9LAMI
MISCPQGGRIRHPPAEVSADLFLLCGSPLEAGQLDSCGIEDRISSQSDNQISRYSSKENGKVGRRKNEKIIDGVGILDFSTTEVKSESLDYGLSEIELSMSTLEEDVVAAKSGVSEVKEEVSPKEEMVVVHSHKGLARKVLPDVLGLFNSRLWRL